MKNNVRLVRNVAVALLLASLVNLGGCRELLCAQESRARAIDAVDSAFQSKFEAVVNSDGRRIVRASVKDAFAALSRGLAEFGYEVENEDLTTGAITLVGPAPAPLSTVEWDSASAIDLPLFRSAIEKHCGYFAGQFANFDPTDVSIIIYVTALEQGPFVELSASMRMRSQRLTDAAGYDRRAYPPPNTFRVGLQKFWGIVNSEIAKL
jgi:hypothetical protein